MSNKPQYIDWTARPQLQRTVYGIIDRSGTRPMDAHEIARAKYGPSATVDHVMKIRETVAALLLDDIIAQPINKVGCYVTARHAVAYTDIVIDAITRT